jgi:hypothetical protein
VVADRLGGRYISAVIQCALNGDFGREDHPDVPVTP